MSGVEVERKWLISGVAVLPAEVRDRPADQIEQGYLTIGAGGAETRVRRKGGKCTLTVKSGTGLVRNEHEVELSTEQFEALWPATEHARLEKTRRAVPAQDGRTIEVDVYGGALEGLVVAEVEFDDPWAAESFLVPYWFGPEVTANDAYKNHSLAVNGRPPDSSA